MKVKRSSSTIALLIQYHDDNTLAKKGRNRFASKSDEPQERLSTPLPLAADFVWFGVCNRPVIEVGWHEEKAVWIAYSAGAYLPRYGNRTIGLPLKLKVVITAFTL